MNQHLPPSPPAPVVTIEPIERLKSADLHDLCDAAELGIHDGGGFGWIEPPPRDQMERYWHGVLTVPGRSLFVGRLDGVIGGSAQLVRPASNGEAKSFAAHLSTSFVAPWARGHGIGRRLIAAVEAAARQDGFEVLHLHVQETQTVAIRLYESMGYVLWGTNPYYASLGERIIAGRYYYKVLNTHPTASGD